MRHHFVLYHYWRSSCSWRLRWALAIKGLSYESRTVNLLNGEQLLPEYLAVNPSGTVPTLLIDGQPFSESLAIIEWLDESYPARPLLPTAPEERLRARQLALLIAAGTQPLQNPLALKVHSDEPSRRQEYARHWISRGLGQFDAVARETAGSCSVGGQVTIADLCLIPQCYNALRFGVDLGAFPTAQRIYRHCLSLPECDMAAPHRQPDAVPQPT